MPADVARLAQVLPELRLVINHAANLRIDGKPVPPEWHKGMRAAAAGKQVFAANGCASCHTLAAAGASGKVGPDLDRVVQDAAKYAKGQPAADYIRRSIVTPDAFVVPGFPKGTMPQTFGQQLSPQQITALVNFLIASGGGGGGKKK